MIENIPKELLIEILEKLDHPKKNLYSQELHLVNKTFYEACKYISESKLRLGESYFIHNPRQLSTLYDFNEIKKLSLGGKFNLKFISNVIKNNPNIHSLKLSLKNHQDSHFINEFFKHINNLVHLEKINLKLNSFNQFLKINNEIVTNLTNSCPKLRKIKFDFNSLLSTISSFNLFLNLKNLEFLSIKNIRFINSVLAPTSHPKLEYINFKGSILDFNIFDFINLNDHLKECKIQNGETPFQNLRKDNKIHSLYFYDHIHNLTEVYPLPNIKKLKICNSNSNYFNNFYNLKTINLCHFYSNKNDLNFLNEITHNITLNLNNYKLSIKLFLYILSTEKVRKLGLKNFTFKNETFICSNIQQTLKKINVKFKDKNQVFGLHLFLKNFECLRGLIHNITFSKDFEFDVDTYIQLVNFPNLKKIIYYEHSKKQIITGPDKTKGLITEKLQYSNIIKFYISNHTSNEEIRNFLNFLNNNNLKSVLKSFSFYSDLNLFDNETLKNISNIDNIQELHFLDQKNVNTIYGQDEIKNFVTSLYNVNSNDMNSDKKMRRKRKNFRLEETRNSKIPRLK